VPNNIECSGKYSGDELFWEVVAKISPKPQSGIQAAVIILLAKYFETCDIFEEPK
jgi:hypothetical protein